MVVASLALPVAAQVATNDASAAAAARLPYIAEFKTTTIQTLPNGTTKTTESTEIDTVDSKGRRRTETRSAPSGGDAQSTTRIQVSDPVGSTLNYWSEPGTSASVVKVPAGEFDSDCAKKMKAVDPLHPVALGEKPAVEELGTKTIAGVEAHGGRVQFTPTVHPAGVPAMPRTNEAWIATDPALEGLIVRLVSDSGNQTRMSRELVKFTQTEPDPVVFQVPAGRAISAREGHAYYCSPGIVGKLAVPPAK
jgi:hypothetical protein